MSHKNTLFKETPLLQIKFQTLLHFSGRIKRRYIIGVCLQICAGLISMETSLLVSKYFVNGDSQPFLGRYYSIYFLGWTTAVFSIYVRRIIICLLCFALLQDCPITLLLLIIFFTIRHFTIPVRRPYFIQTPRLGF